MNSTNIPKHQFHSSGLTSDDATGISINGSYTGISTMASYTGITVTHNHRHSLPSSITKNDAGDPGYMILAGNSYYYNFAGDYTGYLSGNEINCSVSDPTHIHGITDPSHTHGITDNKHHHSIVGMASDFYGGDANGNTVAFSIIPPYQAVYTWYRDS